MDNRQKILFSTMCATLIAFAVSVLDTPAQESNIVRIQRLKIRVFHGSGLRQKYTLSAIPNPLWWLTIQIIIPSFRP